jgi:50S ribosome-binding GTPase
MVTRSSPATQVAAERERSAQAAPSRAPLAARIIDLIDQWRASWGGDDVQEALAAERDRLLEPIKVGLAGRTSSGKSTMANALLGERLAPTGATDTTRVVTYYRRGATERAELILRTAGRRQIVLATDGSLPKDLPVSVKDVAAIDVRVPYCDVLDELTLVDMPGIDGFSHEASGMSCARLLHEELDIDALVFLFHRGAADEFAAINEFEEQMGGAKAAPSYVIGVLSKADERDDADDPLVAARVLARQLGGSEALRSRLVGIVPLVGLLAETARTGALRRRDLDELQRVEASGEADWLVLAPELFVGSPPDPARRRLFELLRPYGLKAALAAIRAGAQSVDDVQAALLGRSGLGELQAVLRSRFLAQSDAIKADRAIGVLDRLTYSASATTRQTLRSQLERLLMDPAMRRIHEFRILRECASNQLELPEWLRVQITAAVTGATARSRAGLPETAPATAVLEHISAVARRAQTYASNGLRSSAQVRASMMLLKSLSSLHREINREIER